MRPTPWAGSSNKRAVPPPMANNAFWRSSPPSCTSVWPCSWDRKTRWSAPPATTRKRPDHKRHPAIIAGLVAGVAQSVEQLIRNEKVGCSIHLSGTKIESPSLLWRGAFAQKGADVMRAIFGIVSLLIVLAIVGVLAKKQLGGTSSVAPGA